MGHTSRTHPSLHTHPTNPPSIMAAISCVTNGAKVVMAKKGTLTLKSLRPSTKKAAPAKKAAPKPSSPAGRPLWLPNTVAPEWLDGSMIGDRGFDPLVLGKPA